jgi:hypothetical protein
MKSRRDDKLSNLPPAARAQLDEWLSTYTYREVIALAATHLRIKTNLRAISAYYNKYVAAKPVQQLVSLAASNPRAAQTAASALLHAHALKAAATPEMDTRTLGILVRYYGQTLRAPELP